jgi:hypothetical protein
MPNASAIITTFAPPAGTPLRRGAATQVTLVAVLSVDATSPTSYNFQLVISSGESGYIGPPVAVAPGNSAQIAYTFTFSPQESYAEVEAEVLASLANSGARTDVGDQTNGYPVS